MLVSYVLSDKTVSLGGWVATLHYFYDESGFLHSHGGNLELRLEHQYEGTTSITAYHTIAGPFLPFRLKEFQEKFPKDLSQEDSNELLRLVTEKAILMSQTPFSTGTSDFIILPERNMRGEPFDSGL